MGENKNMVYILGGVIAVLLVVVGFIVYRNFTAIPDVSDTAGQTTGQTTGGTTTPADGTASPSSEFDPKTATKLTGADAEAHVKAYHDAVVAKKWDAAYKLLPLTGKGSQQYYGDLAGFSKTMEGYGVTSYELSKPVEKGDTISVDAKSMMPMMPQGLTYTWTFKKVDGVWYLESRASAL